MKPSLEMHLGEGVKLLGTIYFVAVKD